MKITAANLRTFASQLHESVAESLPGTVRLDGALTIGPTGVAVAGFRQARVADEFGGGQRTEQDVTITIRKTHLPAASLPKTGALVEVKIGDETEWRRFALRRVEGRGSVQQSWVLVGGEIE